MPSEQNAVPEAGLCARCLYVRRIHSDQGSVFYLCRRSETDSRFPRYPQLPVLTCPGFEACDETHQTKE